MRFFLSILLTLPLHFAFSQNWAVSYKQASQPKNAGKALTPQALAYQLTYQYKTEKDKVRSIFTWITENIAYKLKPWSNRNSSVKLIEDDDTSAILKPLNERVAENVLKSSEALCDGYARLFATLCGYAGIKAEVITGYARTNFSSGSRFRSNHSWNAVYVDSSWHLLDATWASGYVTYRSDEFIRQYNANYFFTPPQEFIYDHYPENLQWSLMDNPPTLKEFTHAPFRSQRFVKSRLLSYSPEKGIIEAAEGDTVKVEIVTEEIMQDLEGTYDPSIDSTILTLPSNWAFLKPAFSSTEKKLRYSYVVPSTEIQWLNLLLHDDVVMRYKLNVTKKQGSVKQQEDEADLLCIP